MLRLLAFALNARDRLEFSRGISTDDEPDLWCKSLSNEIELWIDLGQPDEKRIRKACGRAQQVMIYSYKPRSAEVWWRQTADKLKRFNNLRVTHIQVDDRETLSAMAQRTMHLQCSIQDGQVWLSDAERSIQVLLQPRL